MHSPRHWLWWVAGLFVLTMLAAGLFILGSGIADSVATLRSRSWPVVTGRVTVSEVQQNQIEQSPGNAEVTPVVVTLYGARIRYTYQVNGQDYTGSAVRMGEYSAEDAAYAHQIVDRYPVGSPVQVYYHPADPTRAVLQPGFDPGLWIPLFAGITLSLVGAILGSVFLREIRAARKQLPSGESG